MAQVTHFSSRPFADDDQDDMGRTTRRGYLPHDTGECTIQHVVFRLADSLPRHVVRRLMQASRAIDGPPDIQARKRALLSQEREAEIDRGYGECLLRRREIAAIVAEALIYNNGKKYELLAWCIMPNHVHVVVQIGSVVPLSKIVQSWKGLTSRRINAVMGRLGRVWMRDYYDQCIQTSRLERCVDYVEWNPVKAGLCGRPQDWTFGSAARRIEVR